MGIPWLSLAWTKHIHHEDSAGVTPRLQNFVGLLPIRGSLELNAQEVRPVSKWGGLPVSKRVSRRQVEMPSSLPERTLIWCEIKAAVPVMLKNGVSSIGVLVWSQGKSLAEVLELLLMPLEGYFEKNAYTFWCLLKEPTSLFLDQEIEIYRNELMLVELSILRV